MTSKTLPELINASAKVRGTRKAQSAALRYKRSTAAKHFSRAGTVQAPDSWGLGDVRIHNKVLQMVSVRPKKGDLPRGVVLQRRVLLKNGEWSVQKYHAKALDSHGAVNLGTYNTPEQAHRAWLEFKLQYIADQCAKLSPDVPGLAQVVQSVFLQNCVSK